MSSKCLVVSVLLSLSFVLLVEDALALEDLAPALPADTVVYARSAGIDTLLAEIEATKVLTDGRSIREVYVNGLAEIVRLGAAQTPVPLEVWERMHGSISGMHFALFSVGRDLADFDALLVAETTDPGAIREILQKTIGEEAAFAGEVAGARVMAVEVRGDTTVYYALHEGMLAASVNPERISTFLQARAAPPEASLASLPAYRAGALRTGAGTSLFAWADVQRGLGLILRTLRSREVKEFREIAQIMDLGRIQTACLASGGGVTRARLTFDPAHRWLAAIRGEPGPCALQAFVPEDSLFQFVDSGSVKEKWGAIKALITDEMAFPFAKDVRQGLGEIAKHVGFAFDELAGTLGSEWAMFLPLTEDGTRVDEDALTFAFEIGDREKFDAMFTKFLTSPLVKEMEGAQGGIVRERHGDVEILRGDREGRTDVPTMAVVGDVLLVSGDTTALKAALDAKTTGRSMLGRAGRTVAGLPGSASKLFALNLRSILSEEREFTPLLDLLVPGAVGAAALVESEGSIDVRVNVTVAELVGILAGGELLRGRYGGEKAECLSNFRTIHAAIGKYREARGSLPPGLTALVPEFLPASRLICPLDKGKEEVHCSYGDALRTREPKDSSIEFWCGNRLHGRISMTFAGHTRTGSEKSFLRRLRYQGFTLPR